MSITTPTPNTTYEAMPVKGSVPLLCTLRAWAESDPSVSLGSSVPPMVPVPPTSPPGTAYCTLAAVLLDGCELWDVFDVCADRAMVLAAPMGSNPNATHSAIATREPSDERLAPERSAGLETRSVIGSILPEGTLRVE